LHGVTLGTSAANHASVMDSSNNISGINSLSATTLNAVTQFNCIGNATYSDVNGTILFSGTNNHTEPANTQASNNLSTGTIRSAGGAYFGNDSVFATQITIGSSVLNTTNAGYLVSISPGTVSASKCLVVDVNKDIGTIRNLTTSNINTETISIGNSSNTRPMSIYTSSLANNGENSFVLGKASVSNQHAEFTFKYSTTTGLSALNLGHYGTPYSFTILANGNVGINETSPSYKLDITGTLNATGLITGTLGTSTQPNITSLGTLTSLSVNGTFNSNITDTGTNTVVYLLQVQHLLSSGTTSIGIGSGILFNAPNNSGTTVSYEK